MVDQGVLDRAWSHLDFEANQVLFNCDALKRSRNLNSLCKDIFRYLPPLSRDIFTTPPNHHPTIPDVT